MVLMDGVGQQSGRDVPGLREKVTSPEPIRARAIEALHRIGTRGVRTDEVVQALATAVSNDQSPDLRRRAAEGIGDIGSDDDVASAALRQALKDPDGVQSAAAVALKALERAAKPPKPQ
jgi:HEAT repeat protein